MIPRELQEREQWVCWRQETRDGKPTKVPLQPWAPYPRADSTDPSTWGTFQQAQKAAEVDGVDGIGFVFADDGLVGIDLDKCVLEDGTLHPAAAEIVRDLDSYTELSPTGTGVHVIVRAVKNTTRCMV